MILIPLGVVLLGYQFLWYGATQLMGGGVGFVDLLKPSSIAKVDAALRQQKHLAVDILNASAVGAASAAGDYADTAPPPASPPTPPSRPGVQ